MAVRSDLESMISPGEQVLWRGKPKKKCFILESIFNPMFPFALIWACFDIFFIVMTSKAPTNNMGGIGGFILIFFAFHLMPVWMYLGGVLLCFRKYRNTAYIITDKGVYISGGVFTYSCQMKPFTELANVNIHRGIFDQMLGVGDVVLSTPSMVNIRSSNNSVSRGLSIVDIEEYQEVFSMIKQLQTDIYSDTMYPNDLRPPENHGYQTQYRGRM